MHHHVHCHDLLFPHHQTITYNPVNVCCVTQRAKASETLGSPQRTLFFPLFSHGRYPKISQGNGAMHPNGELSDNFTSENKG